MSSVRYYYATLAAALFVCIALVDSAPVSGDHHLRRKRNADFDLFDNDEPRVVRGKMRKRPDFRPIAAGESSVIELDELDPRKQTVSSSYSIVETSKGPNSVTVTRMNRQYEPKQQVIKHAEHRSPTPTSSSGRHRSKLLSEDERRSRRVKFPVSGENSAATGKLPAVAESGDLDGALSTEEETLKKLKKPSSGSGGSGSAASGSAKKDRRPNSIKDIVEDRQATTPSSAASSRSHVITGADLKDAGSLLGSGSLEEGYEGGYEKDKHFDKEAGKKYVQEEKAEAGEKANQGYKKEDGYEKADKEKHDQEHKKAVLKEEEGEKKAHIDQAKHFEEGYKGRHGEKGKSVTTKGGHKKGHKKSGFHKVHHKDEYKKDEVFYDEAHDDAEKEEHAHEKVKHAQEKGSAEKAGHIDSGYHEGHAAKKGYQDKGHNYDQAKGHHKEASKESHHDEHAKYGKKKGIKEGKKYGHAEAGAGEGGYYEGDDHF